MGVDLHVHIGAYAEIKAGPQIEIERFIACAVHGKTKSKFCPQCGKETQVIERARETKHSLYSLLPEDEYCDMLSWATREDDLDVILAVGNWNADESRLDVDVDGGATISPITQDTIAHCLRAFNIEYEGVLEVLRERAISVDVKFGVLTWWS